jgi:hypothetical protein
VIRYGKCGTKVIKIVKKIWKLRKKLKLNIEKILKNMEERQVEQ